MTRDGKEDMIVSAASLAKAVVEWHCRIAPVPLTDTSFSHRTLKFHYLGVRKKLSWESSVKWLFLQRTTETNRTCTQIGHAHFWWHCQSCHVDTRLFSSKKNERSKHMIPPSVIWPCHCSLRLYTGNNSSWLMFVMFLSLRQFKLTGLFGATLD